MTYIKEEALNLLSNITVVAYFKYMKNVIIMETINQDTVLNTAQNISYLRILGRPRDLGWERPSRSSMSNHHLLLLSPTLNPVP